MTNRRITRAIVLAAGMGSRLAGQTATRPKPLKPVAGIPLLVRVLRALQEAGIREAVIVLGHCGEEIRRVLLAEPSLGLSLSFAENPRFKASNGVSLIAARKFVDRECLLTMADHLYSPELPRRLLGASLPSGVCALGIDRDVERCFDIDDATKVKTNGPSIEAIGKELALYDAIDTGVFRIGPELVDALAVIDSEKGDCSLSDGVRLLAEAGAFHAVDVGDARWIDVDMPEALERAEAMLRVFGERLGDEPELAPAPIVPEAVEAFAPSWVRAASPYKEDHFALANEREGVLRMMSNESPYAPSPRVVQAIVEAATSANLYPTSGTKVATQLASREDLAPENVLLGAGSAELIDVVIRTFVGPGEEVLLSVPTFSMYEARTRLAGGIPILVPLTDEHDVDLSALIRAVTERTKVIFLCSPNNPTGNRIRDADLRRIARLGLPTIVDEAYHELGDEPSHTAIMREYPNVVVLRTFSKAFGLAGLRLGYALGHESVIQLLSRVKIPWNVSAITLAAASAALEDMDRLQTRMEMLKSARAVLCRELRRVPGLCPIDGEGNFVSVDISATGMTAEQMVSEVLAEGILIRSLAVHHAERRFVRITVGTAEQNARCVAAIRRVVSRARRERPAAVGLFLAAPGDAE